MKDMPSWEAFMIPTLRVLADGKVRHLREIFPLVADAMLLTEEQRAGVIKSGQPTYQNRIGWGLSFLTKIGALDRPQKGSYKIIPAGQKVLLRYPDRVTEKQLRAWTMEEDSPLRPYVANKSKKPGENAETDEETTLTPDEQIQAGVDRIREDVAAELLQRLRDKEPAFFEQAVVDLLLAMGYGGSGGRGAVTQLSHDGGIDGVIDQDVLGVSRIYVQAKRYGSTNSVQKPEVQAFVGALSGKADGGVFITTSHFSERALRYAEEVPSRIILINGDRLAELMILYGVGVQVRDTHYIVEIDEDFFA